MAAASRPDSSSRALGIETLGGVLTRLIDKNTTIPANETQVFSTADDNQTAVTIHVLQGERERAQDNKSLGRFDLAEIPSAPRGMPQIEVQFDIDANGILNVAAKDKASGKTQTIVIKASSGLSDDEIDSMVSDAESHAEEDKKFRERVDARNQAEGLIHNAEKTLSDAGEKVSSEERMAVETAVSDLKAVLEDGDKDTIEAKTAALGEAAGAVAQKLYAEEAQQAEGATDESGAAGDDVVDAEFEEVDGNNENENESETAGDEKPKAD